MLVTNISVTLNVLLFLKSYNDALNLIVLNCFKQIWGLNVVKIEEEREEKIVNTRQHVGEQLKLRIPPSDL